MGEMISTRNIRAELKRGIGLFTEAEELANRTLEHRSEVGKRLTKLFEDLQGEVLPLKGLAYGIKFKGYAVLGGAWTEIPADRYVIGQTAGQERHSGFLYDLVQLRPVEADVEYYRGLIGKIVFATPAEIVATQTMREQLAAEKG